MQRSGSRKDAPSIGVIKFFDGTVFGEDVGWIPFQAAYVFDDIDDVYWAHEWLLTDIINEHAPVKERMNKVKACLYERQPQMRCIKKRNHAFQQIQEN